MGCALEGAEWALRGFAEDGFGPGRGTMIVAERTNSAKTGRFALDLENCRFESCTSTRGRREATSSAVP